MPTAQELKKAQEELDAQIVAAEQVEHEAEEAWRQEGERRVWEEEDRLMVERDLCEEGGPSRKRAPRRWLFLPLLDSAGSQEEEEGVPGPSCDKGKGRVPVSEEVWGEITGVICDLCEKKGIPCRWVKVSSLPSYYFWILLTCLYRRQPMFGPAWAANKPGQSTM